MRVTQYGEPVLRQVGAEVTDFGADLAALSQSMVETMNAAEGVGLAAQQINLALQVCVVDVTYLADEGLEYRLDGRCPPLELIMPLTLVNPQLRVVDERTVWGEEGCLSFPGVRGDVPRAAGIEVRYQDTRGVEHILECSGWFARVVQHEVDHLNGRLFIDLMKKRQLRLLDMKLKQIEQQTTEWLTKNPGENDEN